MSISSATALHRPKPNPVKAAVTELGYRTYELKDKLRSWSRAFIKGLSSLKPISSEFQEIKKSPDGLAKEYLHKSSGLKIFNVNNTNSDLTTISLDIPLPETKERIQVLLISLSICLCLRK